MLCLVIHHSSFMGHRQQLSCGLFNVLLLLLLFFFSAIQLVILQSVYMKYDSPKSTIDGAR